MYARASTLQGSPDQADEAISSYEKALATFRSIDGNRGAFMLIDRSSGQGISVTLWEDEAAMQGSRKRADELRQQAASSTDATIVSVHEYDVAVWDVGS
jgi:heme-degrading monooxygenase HmoA